MCVSLFIVACFVFFDFAFDALSSHRIASHPTTPDQTRPGQTDEAGAEAILMLAKVVSWGGSWLCEGSSVVAAAGG